MLGRRQRIAVLYLITTLLFCAQSALSASAGSADALTQQPADHVIMLPIVAGSFYVNPLDLTVERIEVVQSVQDIGNGLPLIANRATIARVFIRSNAGEVLTGIRVRLEARLNGAALPGSPIESAPASIPPSSSRADLSTSINFTLPAAWLNQSDVQLRATVDINNVVAEVNEANNTTTLDITLMDAPVLDIRIIPIRYTHIPSGVTYAAPGDTISSILYRLYPVPTVTVSLRTPYAYSGNLTTTQSWSELLGIIDALRATENAPQQRVYYGLIPGGWFNGGYAGLGYVGFRDSLGLQLDDAVWGQDISAFIAAHEIGHNLGLRHAPGCGAANIDANWPYPDDGHIREIGLDVARMQIKNPTEYYDIMSYCNPRWVSPFSYKRLLTDQQAYASATVLSQPEQVLYIRAAFDEDGSAEIKPVYSLQAVPDLPDNDSEYWLALRDADGRELARQYVAVLTAEFDDAVIRHISAKMPLPAEEVAAIALGRGDKVLAERALHPPEATINGIRTTRGDRTLAMYWDAGGSATLVRYTSDDGATYTTLAADLQADTLELDLAELPEHGFLEVVLSDTSRPARYILDMSQIVNKSN